MFSNMRWYDWVGGFFSYGLWIIWKIFKNNKIGKISKLMITIPVVIFFLVLLSSGIKSEKSKEFQENLSSNNFQAAKELLEKYPNLLIDGEKASIILEERIEDYQKKLEERRKIERAKAEKIAQEKREASIYNSFKIGMNKNNISKKIHLVKKELMLKEDLSYKYIDSNHHKIKIGNINFEVRFVINQNNKVKSIIFTAKNIENISESSLLSIAKRLTNKSLKKRVIKNFMSGKVATIIFANEEIKNGKNDDFRIFFNNKFSGWNPNTIEIHHSITDTEATKRALKKNVEQLF